MDYLLSIIIPTKNRYQYLTECIKTLMELDYTKVEIVIQDNSDDNTEIVSFLKENNQPNIYYYYSSVALSQTENSELAVIHSTGKYCCYIGDDDTVSSSIISLVEYLNTNGFDACVFDMSTYHWPDVVFEKKPKPALSLNISKCRIKKIKSKAVLKKILSWGVQDIKYIPRIYHGIIKKNVLDSIKKEAGSYFPGPSPDMANAISSLLCVSTFLYVRAPIVVSGYSYKSAGGMGLRGAHKGDLKDAKQLNPTVEKYWSDKIPKIWLGYTVWPESAEKAFEAFSRYDLKKKINYYAMYAKIFLKYKEYRKIVLENNKKIKDRICLYFEMVRFIFRLLLERIDLKKRKIFKKQFIVYEKISIEKAKEITDKVNEKLLNEVFK